MASYINPNVVYNLWNQVFTKQRLGYLENLVERYGFSSYFVSLGGPMLLNLQGVTVYEEKNDVIKLSLKVNQHIPFSSYYNETMLQITQYIVLNQQKSSRMTESQTLSQFINLILEQTLQSLQSNTNQIYFHLIKLYLFNSNSDKLFISQWSSQQLIQQRSRISKSILKMFIKQKCQIQSKYYIKLNKKIATQFGVDYITVNKKYVLIDRSGSMENQMNITNRTSMTANSKADKKVASKKSIYTSAPISLIFDQCFMVPDYYELCDQSYNLNNLKNQLIFLQYRKQKYRNIINAIKLQDIPKITWEIFLLSRYDRQLVSNAQKNVLQSINIILNNPMNFLSQIIHHIQICKILLNPNTSFITSSQSQSQMYKIVGNVEYILTQYQKKGDYIYPEISVYLEAIRKLTGVISAKKSIKVNMVRLLLDNLAVMINSIKNSMNSILYTITGTIPQYLLQLNKTLGNEQTKKLISSQTITYQTFLSQTKKLPLRALYMPDQVKRYKQQLSTTQNQTRDLILTKYVKQYQLYEIIYKFYWKLIEGKKILYPLSSLMDVLKNKAINLDFSLMRGEIDRLIKKNKNLFKENINLNRINGIEVYEFSSGTYGSQQIFYSLSKESLKTSATNQYKKFYSKFAGYFLIDDDNYNRKKFKYILSVKSLPFLNKFTEETGGIYVAKFYVDILVKNPQRKPELYNIVYDQLSEFMQCADADQIGIIGLYSSWKNLSNSSLVFHGDSDEVYSWDISEYIDILRYEYKKKLSFQKLYKFLEHCINYNKQIQIRIVYKQGKLIQSCNIVFNFYYQQIQASFNHIHERSSLELVKPLISLISYQDRVFYSTTDIIEWSVLNKVLARKKQNQEEESTLKSIKNNNSLLNKRSNKDINNLTQYIGSLKKIYSENSTEVLIEQILIENEDEMKQIIPSTIKLSLSSVRELSPHYSKLQQSHHQLITILYVLQYMKIDCRNRFQHRNLFDQVILFEYYLIEQCLKDDRFIHLEGLTVELINLVKLIKKFFQDHKDNISQQKQLIWIQNIFCKCIGLIKMLMYSCIIAVGWAVRNNNKLDNDKDKKK